MIYNKNMKKFKTIFTICIMMCLSLALLACKNSPVDNTQPTTYVLTLDKTGQGTIDGSGNFFANTNITVTAICDDGYKFDGWYKGETFISNNNPYIFQMPANELTLTAQFSEIIEKFTLTLNVSGLGTVSGAGEYAVGQYVVVVASAYSGYVFDGWYLYMPENNLTFTAVFLPEPIEKTLTVTKTNGGQVIGSITVVTALSSNSGTFEIGDTINLTAMAGYGYSFDGWYTNNIKVSSIMVYSFTMPSYNITIQARFIAN
jgi:uncharacterized repeat protein (TIGR02543 family)